LTLALWYNRGVNESTVQLASDNNGVPGNVLWEKTYDDLLGSYRSSVHLTDLNGPQINAGTRYWLVSQAPQDGFTTHAWYAGLNGPFVLRGHIDTPGGVHISSEIGWGSRVEIPEPNSVMLSIIGGIIGVSGLLGQRRRHVA
jgi:hypothetical protein